MKHFFISTILFSIVMTCHLSVNAQQWADIYYGTSKGTVFSVYADSVDDYLYVGGNYDTLGPIFYPSRGFGTWDGAEWYDWTLGGFGNDITKAIGRYKGDIIHSVDIGAVFYGEQTEDHRIAKFTCTNVNCHGNTAYAFAEYHGELYVGGTFLSFKDTPDDLLNGICKWDGVQWTKVAGGVRSKNHVNGTGVHSLLVYNDKLYVGGTFDSAGSIACNNIAVWDGTQWSKLGQGVQLTTNKHARVNALTWYMGRLVAGGTFDLIEGDTVSNIAEWDGTAWKQFHNAGFEGTIDCFAKYKKDLYVGGEFEFNGLDSNHIGRWNSSTSTWTSVGGGFTNCKFVRSMCIWKKMLIVGGAFTKIEDTITVANIASWKIGSNRIALEEDDFAVMPDIFSAPSVIHMNGIETITRADVIDQCGRICMTKEFSNGDPSPTMEFTNGKWTAGVYILRIYTDVGTVNKKIVVQ